MVTNILKQVTQTAVLIIILLDAVINFNTRGINKNRTQRSDFKSLSKLIQFNQNTSKLKTEKSKVSFDSQEERKAILEEKYKFRSDESSTRFRIVRKAKRNQIFPENRKDSHIAWAFRSNAVRRIVGGMDTSISMYPYTAAISKHGSQWCGGSIIDEQWVLTAGHCMESAFDGDKRKLKPFTIRAGSSFHNKGGYQARINKVFFPSEFTPGNVDYDFSLLRLDRPMPIGRNIAVLDLPSKDFEHAEGNILIITGWGSTNETGLGNIPDRLHFVPVPMIRPEECQQWYKFHITPRMLCAGYDTGGKDACNHDSGGPAVQDGVLLGVVSFGGKKCGDPRSPGVYSRVSVITEFVKHTIRHNEASTVPELMPKIQIARQREEELQKFKEKVEHKRNIMKNWFRGIIQTPQFIDMAKKKLREAGLLTRRNFNEVVHNTSNLDEKTIDGINLKHMVNDRILEERDGSEADKFLRILALHEVILNDGRPQIMGKSKADDEVILNVDGEEKPLYKAKNESGSLEVFMLTLAKRK